jgi:DNA-binding LytR/AlgR family response regulator
MKLFIAEDEPPARERLVETPARVAPDAQVLGHADSVQGTARWLAEHAPPDLLLLDVQLADGLSLDLFQAHRVQLPVVFTTAYDRFALDAFRALAVDYLLKPVVDAALAQALAKVRQFRAHFGEPALAAAYPPRLACRLGAVHHALPVAQLARLVSLDKSTHAVALDGRRYSVDRPLAELEHQLDPTRFFRATRQVIVAAHGVRHYAGSGKGRLALTLAPDGDVLAVPQERAAAFRTWWERAPGP